MMKYLTILPLWIAPALTAAGLRGTTDCPIQIEVGCTIAGDATAPQDCESFVLPRPSLLEDCSSDQVTVMYTAEPCHEHETVSCINHVNKLPNDHARILAKDEHGTTIWSKDGVSKDDEFTFPTGAGALTVEILNANDDVLQTIEYSAICKNLLDQVGGVQVVEYHDPIQGPVKPFQSLQATLHVTVHSPDEVTEVSVESTVFGVVSFSDHLDIPISLFEYNAFLTRASTAKCRKVQFDKVKSGTIATA